MPGLEETLAEEAGRLARAEQVALAVGRVEFAGTLPNPGLRNLLVCDALGLLVRHSEGDFGGRRGLTELRGKLARTDFERHGARWAEQSGVVPTNFRVRAVVGRGCEFAFFDVLREATAVLERRLGLPPTGTGAGLVVDLECSPTDLYIGLALPLPDWTEGARRTMPRSLVGALVRLARPAPQLAVCDPDCGSGELLRAWATVVRRPRLLGLTLGRRGDATWAEAPLVGASPRAWPVGHGRLSRVLSALPRISDPSQLAHLLGEVTRCLAVGGCAVLATDLTGAWRAAVEAQPRLTLERSLRVHDGERKLDVLVLTRGPDARPRATPTTAGARARATRDLADRISKRRPKRARRGGPPTSPP